MSDMHVCRTCGGVEDCRPGCSCAGCIGAARDEPSDDWVAGIMNRPKRKNAAPPAPSDPVAAILAVECPEGHRIINGRACAKTAEVDGQKRDWFCASRIRSALGKPR